MTDRGKWTSSRDISSPAELADVIRVVAEAVRSGELRALALSDEPFTESCDILQLSPTGPWPDFLDLRFEEVETGKRFRLKVETYHGTGGRWGDMDARRSARLDT
jgi:hypothetical protein